MKLLPKWNIQEHRFAETNVQSNHHLAKLLAQDENPFARSVGISRRMDFYEKSSS